MSDKKYHIVRREVSARTRGGKIIKASFIAFNAVMALAMLAALRWIHHLELVIGNPPRVVLNSHDIIQLLLLAWAIGGVILGTLVIWTRRTRVAEVRVRSR